MTDFIKRCSKIMRRLYLSECRICFSQSELYEIKNGFAIAKCPKCGFGQVDVSPDVLAAFYDKSYFDGDKAAFSQQERQTISPAMRFWIESQISGRAPLRVLEIGPGLGGPVAGYFQQTRVHDTYEAIEISAYATERLCARGLTVRQGRVVDPQILDACRSSYDLVFATEVIEHDLEPHAFLSAVYTLLKPGGRAAFTTGNFDGWVSRHNKKDWYYLDPPAHVSFYTPRSARKALSTAGFKNARVECYGFRHIDLVLKVPLPFLRDPLLAIMDRINMSTGMTISADKPRST